MQRYAPAMLSLLMVLLCFVGASLAAQDADAGSKDVAADGAEGAQGESKDQGADKVVVLGGHMGAYQVDDYPWLATEKEFIRLQLNDGTPCWESVLAHSCSPTSSAGGPFVATQPRPASYGSRTRRPAERMQPWRPSAGRW